MNIVSIDFFVFAIVLTILYFTVPKKAQWIVLLFGNVIFYAFAGIGYIGYMIIISGATYFGALKLEKITVAGKEKLRAISDADEKKKIKASTLHSKRVISALAIVLSMGIWVVLKYSNFFVDNFNVVNRLFNDTFTMPNVSWALPLGISFYTFHAVGYLVDVYRGKYPAEKNYLKYLTFISYFPHIIQGPFSRFDELGKSIEEEHKFSYERLCNGCARMLWGYFKKLVVADKIGVAATTIFADSNTYSGFYMIFAMCAYGVQLYADFSGYMDIVCGFSNILDIQLAENFQRPYFAKTVDEFWRRWHITLGTWFRDYVFYPVSMGKTGQKMGKWARKKWGPKMGKLVPGYFALIFVWTATGLWHGANWTYLIWGYLNLLVITLTMQLTDFYEKLKSKLHINSENFFWKLFCIVRTFALVCFFRFFSAAPDMKTANLMLKNTFGSAHIEAIRYPYLLFVGIEKLDIILIIFGTCLIVVKDILDEEKLWDKVIIKCPTIIRDVCFTILILTILLSIGNTSELMEGFMYASF